jgi:glyoxylase-like metal-dependent hydrolase (beta-lactamase superfamily II)
MSASHPLRPAAVEGVRLYPFTTGTVSVGLEWIKNNQFGGTVHVPVPWYVITHPRGTVLIDGGCPAAAGVDDVAHWGPIVTEVFGMRCHMHPDEACLPTVQAHGFDPESVRFVLQTHLHADHVGALHVSEAFPNARFVTARREWEYSGAPDAFAAATYVRKDLDKPAAWMFVEDGEDGYDLYGDGAILMYHTPGHTVGHLSFLIRLADSGSVIVMGDACDTIDHWNELCLPGFALSNQDAIHSIRRLHRVAEREDALVLFGHDENQWTTVKKDGEFYA